MHNNYLDSHIYIIKKWVLSYLKEKRQIRSIKADLIPRLVRKQFKSNYNVVQTKAIDELDVEKEQKIDLLDFVEVDELTKTLENLDNFSLVHDVVKPVKNEVKTYPSSAVRCLAVIQKDGISLRANTVTGYFESNKRIRAIFPSSTLKDKPTIPTTPTTPTQGPPIKTQIGADCIVSPSNKIGDKTSIKRSSIGEHCTIGEKVKIANCVIMNHVTIKDNCN